MNYKIILSVVIAFAITISTFSLVYNLFPDPTITRNNHEFYLEKLNPKEEKIFLIGSKSHRATEYYTHY